MNTPNLSEFIKAYDVRGLVPEQLNEPSPRAHRLGVRPGRGPARRGRSSSSATTCAPPHPTLARAFARGRRRARPDVTLIGLCSTDGLYYASGALGVPGAMFTASHNPARYNGIKLCRSGARPVGQDSGLAEVRDLAQQLLDDGAERRPAAGRAGRDQRA